MAERSEPERTAGLVEAMQAALAEPTWSRLEQLAAEARRDADVQLREVSSRVAELERQLVAVIDQRDRCLRRVSELTTFVEDTIAENQ